MFKLPMKGIAYNAPLPIRQCTGRYHAVWSPGLQQRGCAAAPSNVQARCCGLIAFHPQLSQRMLVPGSGSWSRPGQRVACNTVYAHAWATTANARHVQAFLQFRTWLRQAKLESR